MQDITIKKIKQSTKVRGKCKRKQFSMIHVMVAVMIAMMFIAIAQALFQKGDGVTWIYGQGSLKMVHQSNFDAKELLLLVESTKTPVVAKQKQKSYYFSLIERYFPEKPHVMYAIAKEESGLNPNAVNYNCRYKISQKGKTKTTVYDSLTATHIDLAAVSKGRLPGYVSTWCRKGHSQYAWSKDSGLFGINSVHTKEVLTPEEQVQMARTIYEREGLNAWVSYKTKRYLKHMRLDK